MFIELSRSPVHIRDHGGRGETFVLVHGLGGSLANWDILGPRLTDRGHIVAIDLPGFGLTPPWGNWDLETHAQAVRDVIDHFGAPATLVGNSMGALISQIVASTTPDLVERLILISPAAPPRLPDPHINWRNARHLLLYATPGLGRAASRAVLRKSDPRALTYESLDRITQGRRLIPVEMIEEFVALAETRRRLPWAADAVPRTGASIRKLFTRRSRWVEMIRGVTAPTLIVQGWDDPIVSPTSVEHMGALRPDWDLVRLANTGHTPQIDAPVRLIGVIDRWLDEHRNAAIGA